MAHQIAIFGKGGSGKTTIAANLCAALAEAENRVLLVGLSPTADSSHLVLGGATTKTLGDFLTAPSKIGASALVASGYRGIGCIETGDFYRNEQCTSRNISESLQSLLRLGVIQEYAPDFVIYDIPGDVGCSGTTMLGDVAIQTALLVASADFQSMFAANRFASMLSRSLPAEAITLVANGNASSFEDSLVADYAKLVGLPLAATIPRSLVVRHSELYGKTVIEAAPLSTHAYTYRRLAKLLTDQGTVTGRKQLYPLSVADLRHWARSWGERLGELEFGIIQDGAGI